MEFKFTSTLESVFETQEWDIQGLVIENGSSLLKAGFSGDDAPVSFSLGFLSRAVFPTVHGRACRILENKDFENVTVGDEALKWRKFYNLTHPLHNDGSNIKWEQMEEIWSHTFLRELRVCAEDHPVLMTSLSLMNERNIEKMSEILFEKLKLNALYVADPSVLSLYASGRVTGTVLNTGDIQCRAISCFYGVPINYSLERMNKHPYDTGIAGKSMTEYLCKLLHKRNVFKTQSSESQKIGKDIKEKLCYVALNYEEELKKYETSNHHGAQNYELPDGSSIMIREERFVVPEILFNPSLIDDREDLPSVTSLVADSIGKCHPDMRRDLWRNIVLAGGTTKIDGIVERLTKELSFHSNFGVKVSSPAERMFSSWIGGSILTSLSTFDNWYVFSDSYEEYGGRAVKVGCQMMVTEREDEDSYLRWLRGTSGGDDIDRVERMGFSLEVGKKMKVVVGIGKSQFIVDIPGIIFLLNFT